MCYALLNTAVCFAAFMHPSCWSRNPAVIAFFELTSVYLIMK